MRTSVGVRILICDDSSTARRMLVASLPDDRPYDVVEADSGERAIEEFQKTRADLVLLDLTLPEMTGYEVLEALRKLDPTVRVVVISSDVQDEARKRVFAAGATAFLAKPVQIEEVRKIVRTHA